MPICTIQALALPPEKKQILIPQLTAAMKKAFVVDGEYQIFFSEYGPGAVAHNNEVGGTYVPIVSIECPNISIEKKAVLAEEADAAIAAAYGIPEAMMFLRQYPLENVAKAGKLLVHRRAEFPAETQTRVQA